MPKRLIRRTTTEEYIDDDVELSGLEDEKDAEDEEDGDEDEPVPARRRR